MFRPVTPGLLPEWIKLKGEFACVVDELVEQGARVGKAAAALQQLRAGPDGSYTQEELRAKQEDLDWAEFFRQETVALAASIEEKLLTVCKMDKVLRVCNPC